MKRQLLTLVSIVCFMNAWCADGDTFVANTVEGVEMTFKVISENEKTCQVGVGLGFSVIPAISNETTGEITIPSIVKGYNVTTLAVNAFYGCSGITNINLPNTITAIGSNALEGTQWYINQPDGVVYLNNILYRWKGTMTTSTSVDIKEGTIGIAERAFDRCSNLTSVTIPQGVTNIGDCAFFLCSGLKTISIPGTVISIGQESFYGCKGLSAIDIPNSVKKIGIGAFYDCTNIATVTFGDDVSSVGQNAFRNTKWLGNQQGLVYIGKVAYKYCGNMPEETNILIKDGTTEISAQCFQQCTTLNSITFPSSLETIGSYAFYGCNKLASVIIPYGVKKIESSAFARCTGLTSISFPNSMTSLEGNSVNGAFYQCSNLKTIFIPKSIISIDDGVFYGCLSLSSITVDAENTVYDSRDNCNAIIDSKTNTLILGCNGTIAIPEGITTIGTGAFYNAKEIKEITIPQSVTEIGYQAFSFCNALNDVTVLGKTPPTLVDVPFIVNNITLHVPSGCKSLYMSADGWGEFKAIVEPPIQFADSNVKAICVAKWDANGDGDLDEYEASLVKSLNYAFSNNETITSFDELRFFTGLTTISDNDFYGCSTLKSVIIPSGITTIGMYSFYNCSLESLDVDENNTTFYSPNKCNAVINRSTQELVKGCKTTVIPTNVTTIGGGAFWGCNGLVSFTIPSTITSINEYAFALCKGLTSINIPSSVSYMGNCVFNECTSLTSVDISDGLTKIPSNAFNRCTNLVSISIPNSIISIGVSAFERCSALQSIVIPNSVTSIGSYAFAYCSNLTSVTVEWKTPVYISNDDFPNRNNATLYVPKGTTSAYERASYWKEFGTILEQGTVLTNNNRIYADNVNVYIGHTADMQISMSNEDSFTAYQFDLVLPDGITIAKNKSNKYIVTKSERYSDNTQQVNIEDRGNNTFRFICVSLQNAIINGTEGTILNVSLQASANIAEGTYDATIKNIVLTTADEIKMKPNDSTFMIETATLVKGDANGDNEIDVADVVSIINYIMGNPSENFNMLAADINDDGEVDIFDVMKAINLALTNKNAARSMARATRSTDEQAIITPTANGATLGVNDASRFTAFQFDVEVDEGIVLKDAILNENTGNHKIYFIKNGQNTYRVIGVSMDNSTLVSNGNDLVELRVSNSSKIQISNIVFITLQEDRIHFAASSADVTGISDIKASQAEEVFDLSGRKLDTDRSRLPKGVYIINNKKVVNK